MPRAALLGVVALTLLVAIASTMACREQAEPGPSPSPSPRAEAVPSSAASACDMATLREASQQISRRFESWSPRLGTVPDLAIDVVAAVWAFALHHWLTEAGVTTRRPIVGPLYDLLAEEVDKAKQLAERNGEAWAVPLLLVAHRELPWSTLRPVVVSATRAGFRQVALVGLADDRANPLRSIVIRDASASGAPLELGETTTVQALVDAAVARKGPTRLLP